MKLEDLVLKQTCECCPELYECIDDWHLTLYDDNREDLLLESKKRLVKFWNNFDGVEL